MRFLVVLCSFFVFSACKTQLQPPKAADGHEERLDHEDVIAASLLVGLKNGRVTGPGLLVGGQPTQEQLHTAKDAGFDVIINLQKNEEPGAQEEATSVTALGMQYVTIPTDGANGLTKGNAIALAKALKNVNGDQAILHCASGNRAGALLGLKLFVVDSAHANDAIRYAKRAGMTTLEDPLRKAIARLCERPMKDQRCVNFKP